MSVPILGYKACEIAYNEAEPWLEALLPVLDKNQRVVMDFFAQNFPKITSSPVEGTYLQWLNFKCLGMADKELEDMNINKAQLFTDEGYIFGEEGSGYERINLAAPTSVLVETLERFGKVLKEVYKP
jgi:aminotransferase/cystathionine beta-lyase